MRYSINHKTREPERQALDETYQALTASYRLASTRRQILDLVYHRIVMTQPDEIPYETLEAKMWSTTLADIVKSIPEQTQKSIYEQTEFTTRFGMYVSIPISDDDYSSVDLLRRGPLDAAIDRVCGERPADHD